MMKEQKTEKKFTDINAAMQQYFLVTCRQLEPLPPKPVSLIFSYHLKITIIAYLHYYNIIDDWNRSFFVVL